MTTPPFQPPSGDPGTAGDATQPVPDLTGRDPVPAEAWQAPGRAVPPPPSFQPPAQPGQPSSGATPMFAAAPQPGSGYPPAFQPVAPESTSPLVPPDVTGRSGGSSRVLNVALAVAVLVATAGVAFAVGRTTAPTTTATAGRFNGGFGGVTPNGSFDPNAAGGFRGNGGFAGRGGLGGGLMVTGTVDSMTADSITITTGAGQPVTIGLDPNTTYHQQNAASSSDVQTGKKVILEVTGGFRPGTDDNSGGANNGGGTFRLGTASDVTVVP